MRATVTTVTIIKSVTLDVTEEARNSPYNRPRPRLIGLRKAWLQCSAATVPNGARLGSGVPKVFIRRQARAFPQLESGGDPKSWDQVTGASLLADTVIIALET